MLQILVLPARMSSLGKEQQHAKGMGICLGCEVCLDVGGEDPDAQIDQKPERLLLQIKNAFEAYILENLKLTLMSKLQQ